jgi:hypothetical protein
MVTINDRTVGPGTVIISNPPLVVTDVVWTGNSVVVDILLLLLLLDKNGIVTPFTTRRIFRVFGFFGHFPSDSSFGALAPYFSVSHQK